MADTRPDYAKGPHKVAVRRLYVANPSERRWTDGRNFILWFGQVGTTRVLVYAKHLEDALEVAAGYCADKEWYGLVIPHETFEAEYRGTYCDDQCNHDQWECSAEMDMTLTESGWVSSSDWGIIGENLSPMEISDYYHDWRKPLSRAVRELPAGARAVVEDEAAERGLPRWGNVESTRDARQWRALLSKYHQASEG